MDTYREAIAAIQDAIERARASGRRNMNAMSLATVDDAGRPAVRTVLLKAADERGLAFFTDARSGKARELAARPVASACMYWEPIEEQARVDGRVEPVSGDELEADFAGRPRAGKLLIWASEQSAPLGSKDDLRAAVAAAESRYPGDVPRPPHWAGYRLVPDRVEFWRGSRDRMHERLLYRSIDGGWSRTLLSP